MAFDIDSARKAGYSDSEIADHLGSSSGFDTQKARSSGYSDGDIISHLNNNSRSNTSSDDPAEGMTLNVAGLDTGIKLPKALANGLAGAGKAFMDAGRGLGIVDSADESTKAAEKKMMSSTAGKVGNIAGGAAILAPTALIPGANTVGGAALVNGLANAALTEGGLAERGKSALAGAAGGALGQSVMRGISRVVKPETAPEVKQLIDDGISLTPGQIMGGAARRMEDAMTSVPIIGDAIKAAQRRGIEDFNKVALSRAVNPIGGEVQGVGREAVESAKQQLGKAYDDLLPSMQANTLEPQFVQNMSNLRGLAASLPEREAKQFDTIVARELEQRLAPNGVLSGDNLKAAQAGLRDQANGFSTATDGYQRQLGGALKQAEQEVRDLVVRSSPDKAAELAKVNEGYANFKRIQRAAAGVGAQDGVFTPAQLQSAVKALDKSKDKARFSEGNALMQDLTDAAKSRLSQTVPDSGTPFRLATMATLGAGAFNPLIPLSAIAGSAGYTKAGQKAITALLTKRPEIAQWIAESIKNRGGQIAQTLGGATALSSQSRK